jgi:tripartite ATP-independent transporter DctM subunit
MSGSKSADMVAVGSSLNGMLDKGKYDKTEATAVLSATAVMGETIPPSLALLVLGSVTSLSIETLFAGGILPAAILGLCLIGLVCVRARRRTYVRQPVTARAMAGSGLRSLPALALPVLLVGGILGGFGTPTEVSSFAVVFGFALVFVLYRVGPATIWKTSCGALAMGGMILFVISAAGPLAWLLTAVQIPQRFASFAVDVGSGHTWIFVLISMVIMVIFGALLEGAAAIIILAPILVPAAIDIGVNPIVFGLVLVIALGIGANMPLIGIGNYIAASTLGTTIEESARPSLYYLGIAGAGMLLIAFVPEFALLLPRLFGYAV